MMLDSRATTVSVPRSGAMNVEHMRRFGTKAQPEMVMHCLYLMAPRR